MGLILAAIFAGPLMLLRQGPLYDHGDGAFL